MLASSAAEIATRPLLRAFLLGLGVASLSLAHLEADASPRTPAVTTFAPMPSVPADEVPPKDGGDDPAGASEKAADESTESKPDVVCGKLMVREVDKDTVQFVVRVGGASIVLEDVEAKSVAKLNGKFVSARGRLVSNDAGHVLHVITDDTNSGVAVQEPTAVPGVLGTQDGEKSAYRLTADDGTVYGLPKSANAKVKALLGKHVEVDGVVMSGPQWSSLEAVTDVRRKLLPDEREPKDGEEAITGSWTGKLVAVKVPSGAPGVKSGDAFDFAFHIAEDRAETTGRLLATYDIDGARLQKFKAKDRSARVDLSYTFGKGSYPLRLEGTFSEDWKTFAGEWSSGFLGSGTFEVAFKFE